MKKKIFLGLMMVLAGALMFAEGEAAPADTSVLKYFAAAAAVGLAIGVGLYEAGILCGVVIFFVLSLVHRWDNQMRNTSRVLEIYVELNKTLNLGDFMRKVREMGLDIDDVRTEPESSYEEGKHAYIMVLKSKVKRNHEQLFESIRALDGVAYVEGL